MEMDKETPTILTYIDSGQSKLIMEFTLLAVEAKDINLMMFEEGCYLSAPAEDLEYAATLSFCCPVKPSEAKAKYEGSGSILTVEVPLKDALKNAVKVPIE